MRQYYRNIISQFIEQPFEKIWGRLTSTKYGDLLQTQKYAWSKQIDILKKSLIAFDGELFLEYSIPRLGKRVDAILLIKGIIFVIEFKVGAREFLSTDINQVWDYALDLKYFHEESHSLPIVPILIATETSETQSLNHKKATHTSKDQILSPLVSNGSNLSDIITEQLGQLPTSKIDNNQWGSSRYAPTPTIIEAAQFLYNNHSVLDISRSDAENLSQTSDYLLQVAQEAKSKHNKVICFVTGVPGAGKTLVGLNISTKSVKSLDANAIYLSGNGPLVNILIEALSRDKVAQHRERGEKISKEEAKRQVKSFIQNVHHFRDSCLEGTLIVENDIVADREYYISEKNLDKSYAPIDHIAIFDEAQRAWTQQQTADFMNRKKSTPDFPFSEPEFLISCMNRHNDWAMVICLVGGGQEINKGEAGISEWIHAITRKFPDWHVHLSSRLTDKEYAAGGALNMIATHPHVFQKDELHLAVSLRSFRAEKLSLFIHQLLDREANSARNTLLDMKDYPIILTRCLDKAKQWLKNQARGTERYGILVSSQASRLKPLGIDIRSELDPVHWFLEQKTDVRSSYYLEDAVTEFDVQGLELDYSCLVWDADFRYAENGWTHHSFRGTKWIDTKSEVQQSYKKNAYRVLLTRARQGMVIVVPRGSNTDPTRKLEFYDTTYRYLKSIGLEEL